MNAQSSPTPANPRTDHRALVAQALGAAMLAAALVAAGLGPAAAQVAERVVGSGRPATEARSLGEFEAIALRGSMDMVVRQGSPGSVTVTADDNLLPLVETVVETGTGGARLSVRWKSGVSLSTKSKVTVQVVNPRLVALASSGSGDMLVEALETPRLELALSGSGDAALPRLKTDDLRISISGSGDVKTDGQAARLKISISGSGDVNAAELRAGEVTVGISGSGDVAVHASKKLAVTIAGSGDVVYTGDAEVTRSVAGSGSVKRR
jgi:hypothetical protein